MDKYQPHKSIFDLDANIVMLIAYFGAIIISFIPGINFFAWAVPLIIFFIEKDSKYVKFHAMQSLLLEVAVLAIALILGLLIGLFTTAAVLAGSGFLLVLTALTSVVTILIPIVLIVFSIIAAIKGWKYDCYKISIIGNWAEKIANK